MHFFHLILKQLYEVGSTSTYVYSWETQGLGLKTTQLAKKTDSKAHFLLSLLQQRRVVLKTMLSIAYKLLTNTHCKNISKHSTLLLAPGTGYGRKSGPNLDFQATVNSWHHFLYKCTSMGVPFGNAETLTFNYKIFK